MEIKWEKQTGKHQLGEWCRVGKVIIGSAGWYGGTKGETKNYGCRCDLPGIKQPVEQYATIEEAKARLERMVAAWFKWTTEPCATSS
jgi:hypothetical protein